MATTTSARFAHTEGTAAPTIEAQTAKLPSTHFSGHRWYQSPLQRHSTSPATSRQACSSGQWAPTLLILGVYNELVKQLGSDSIDSRVRA
jgi:hypothetical protein